MFQRKVLNLAKGILFFLSSASQAEIIGLTWDPNTDEIAGYKVYQGRASGVYDGHTDVGMQILHSTPNLLPSTTYYFVVKAYNREGIESLPSNEVSYTSRPGNPHLPPPVLGNLALEGGDSVKMDLTKVQAGLVYTLEVSEDLQTWTKAREIEALEEQERLEIVYVWPEGVRPPKFFFRLRWQLP
jgi:hypothetical protein